MLRPRHFALPLLVVAPTLVGCQHEGEETCGTVRDVAVTSQAHPSAVYYGGHCVPFTTFGTLPAVFQTRGEALYFLGTTDGRDSGLWISQGTTTDSRLLVSSAVFGVGSDRPYVKEILPASGGALFAMMAPCIFPQPPTTPPVSRVPLWWVDDSGNSQMLLGDHEVREVALADDRAFFTAIAADRTQALWVADLRTRQVQELARFAVTGELLAISGQGAFVAGRRSDDPSVLWYSDGTAAGTRGLASACSVLPTGLAAAGRRAFFLCGRELWTSDGTPAGTARVPGAPTASNAWLSGLTELGGKLAFFYLPDMAQAGAELWTTDGTASTQRLASFTLPRAAAYPAVGSPSIVFGGKLHFCIGDMLWRSDGTAAGTASIVDLPPLTAPVGPPPSPSALAFFATLRGTLFVVMGEAEVWRVDGIAAQRVTIDPQVWEISAFAATPSRINYAAALSDGSTLGSLRALTCAER